MAFPDVSEIRPYLWVVGGLEISSSVSPRRVVGVLGRLGDTSLLMFCDGCFDPSRRWVRQHAFVGKVYIYALSPGPFPGRILVVWARREESWDFSPEGCCNFEVGMT